MQYVDSLSVSYEVVILGHPDNPFYAIVRGRYLLGYFTTVLAVGVAIERMKIYDGTPSMEGGTDGPFKSN